MKITVPGQARRDARYDVSNHETLYKEIAKRKTHPGRAKAYHQILGRALNPKSHFLNNSYDVVREARYRGGQIALAMQHRSNLDPIQIGAAVQREKMLRFLRATTMIGAKVELFKCAPLIDDIVMDLGSFPVWRKPKEHKDPRHILTPEEIKYRELQPRAGSAFIAAAIDYMNAGGNLAMYVEGTRNKTPDMTLDHDDLPKILPVMGGFGKIVSSVEPSKDITIVTAAIDYPNNSPGRTSIICFDVPENQDRTNPHEITSTITDSLRTTLHAARLLNGTIVTAPSRGLAGELA